MKLSHVHPEVVTHVIKNIEQHFGKMTVRHGRVHEFLGMVIDYSDPGVAHISMKSYLKEAIRDSQLGITRSATTPAQKNLFDVDSASTFLDPRNAILFRSIVCKLLYVARYGRPDLLTAVCFLATRVSQPVEQDERKLRRLLEYIHGSIDLTLTIGATDLQHLHTWVDASYGVHPNMRSHTGGLVSFGIGGLTCRSSKQKLNTKSSTEAELVGASDYLPHVVWILNFLRAQGYPVSCASFHQDNQSAIRLAKNGRSSAGPKCHINLRYFWITDCLRREKIDMQYCPTECMLADFLTKPLQGSLFTRFRSVLLGLSPIASLLPPPVLERVEKKTIPLMRTSRKSSHSNNYADRRSHSFATITFD